MVRRDVRDDARPRSTGSPRRGGGAPSRRLENGRASRPRPAEDRLARHPARASRPGSTTRSSTSTPSEVVVPTRRPAYEQDVGHEPGDRPLAVRPADRDDRYFCRSASLIIAAAWPGPPRSGGAPARAAVPGSRSTARRDREASRSVSARAASAIAWARSAPVHGNVDDPVARVRRAMDRDPAAALAVFRPEATRASRPPPATSPASHAAGRRRPRRTSACRPGRRSPYHVRRRPTATSTLTTGSSRYTFGPSSRRISTRRTIRARIASGAPS